MLENKKHESFEGYRDIAEQLIRNETKVGDSRGRRNVLKDINISELLYSFSLLVPAPIVIFLN